MKAIIKENYYSYRTNESGEKIPGLSIPVIINNSGYQLTTITVYKDGVIDIIGGNTMEEFIDYLKSGYITIEPKQNSDIYIYNLGVVKYTNFISIKSKEDLIKEVEDCINALNERETRWGKCRDLFKQYLLKDSENNLQMLCKAFNDLPNHERVIFEYVDWKDPLCDLMKDHTMKFDKEARKFMLNDYFDEVCGIDDLQ